MFYHTNDVAESKMARAMLRFAIETAVFGREIGSARGRLRAGIALWPLYAAL